MTIMEQLSVLRASDRVLLKQEGQQLYAGYKYMLDQPNSATGKTMLTLIGLSGKETVKRIDTHLEVKHRNWQKEGLIPPIRPDMTPDFLFSDLQVHGWILIEI